MKRALLLLFTLFIALYSVRGQNFQFGQYDFTDQKVNPAMVSSDDFSDATLVYRNQSTSSEFPIKSTFFSLDYPLNHGKRGERWGGVGVFFLNDKEGRGNAFRLDQFGLSYAFAFQLPKNQTINLGVSGSFNTRRFTHDEFLTESQFVNGFGFDESLPDGENFGDLSKNYVSVNTAIYWEMSQPKEGRVAYAGITLGNLNQPNTAFFDENAKVNSNITFTGGGKVYENDNFSILPELLLFYNGAGLKFNAGPTFHFPLDKYSIASRVNNPYFDVGLKYYTGNNLMSSVEFGTSDWAVGLNYETGNEERLANEGTFEIALRYRKGIPGKKTYKRKKVKRKKNKIKKSKKRKKKKNFVKKKRKSKKNKRNKNRKRRAFDRSKSIPKKTEQAETINEKPDTEVKKETVPPVVNVQPEKKQNDLPLPYQKNWIVGFEFDKEVINGESRLILEQLANILTENDGLGVRLSGHTDSVGSLDYNIKLSIRRAESVKRFLIEKGISADKIVTEGKGETQPIADNKTLKGRLQNRRVEIEVVNF